MNPETDAYDWFAQVGVKHPEPELTPEAEQAEAHAYLLSLEVSSLWGSHRSYQSQSQEMRAEVIRVRQRLADLLYEMNRLLAVPGCCGRFSHYLRMHRIPRATANRLIQSHERRLNPDKCIVETLPEPTDGQIRRLARSVLPRIRRVVPTIESLDKLLVELRTVFENVAAERAEAQAAATVIEPSSEGGEPVVPVPAERTVPWLVEGEVM